jgi:hypothetical protein
LKVVLKTIVERAVQLSGTDGGSIFYYRDGHFELGETTGLDELVVARCPTTADDIFPGRCILRQAVRAHHPSAYVSMSAFGDHRKYYRLLSFAVVNGCLDRLEGLRSPQARRPLP